VLGVHSYHSRKQVWCAGYDSSLNGVIYGATTK
jgi:hypothetical protein